MTENKDDIWIVDPSEYESQCECIRSKTAYIYTYPFVAEVAKTGAKVITRTGRTVKNIRINGKGANAVITGELDGEKLVWDAAGRHDGPYKDSPLDLRISERYFYKDWKTHFGMSNAEFAVRYGRPHPTVKIPE